MRSQKAKDEDVNDEVNSYLAGLTMLLQIGRIWNEK